MRDDILLDDAGDLLEDGDEWVEGESDEIDVQLIFLSELGGNREFPYAGFGAWTRLKSRTSEQLFIRDLTVALENDGFDPTIDVSNGLTAPIITV